MPRPNLAEAAWKDTSVALMLKEPGWGSPGCFHLEKLAGPQTRTVSPERTGSQHSEPASPCRFGPARLAPAQDRRERQAALDAAAEPALEQSC